MAKSSEVDGVMRNHLAAGTKVKGDIITQGDIRIDGTVDGSIVAEGKLVVGNTGHILGEVTCTTANISGTIEGHLDVAEMMKVQATGKVSGEICYGKLTVEPGAELEGKFSLKGKVKNMTNSGSEEKRAQEKSA